jgi:excisionase family DNA binding protein
MELMTIKQSAQMLKVSVGTVRNLLRRGELPALRVGKQIRFVREDLEHWIRHRVRELPESDEDESEKHASSSRLAAAG